ncbi:MAG: alpha/beta fold hydrolase, partial [Chloroflexi bacterium]|nr:alpha/beta fold hydrolase [Chloroflexota bacterium]
PADAAASQPTAPPPATAVPTEIPTAEPEPAEEAETAPEPTIAPPTMAPETAVLQPTAENVTIEAADGLTIYAAYDGPGGMAPFPGVILLHMNGSKRQVWQEIGFVQKLVANGYAVLAVDMRGHGETGGVKDWVQAEDDMLRVWAYFAGREEVDGERTAVIGASIGSSMALVTGANETAVKTVALLSPGLNYFDIDTPAALAGYGERPLFIAASEADAYSADSAQTLAEQALGEAELVIYDGAEHGTDMFPVQPDLADLLLAWINRHLPET